ncbi:thioredoxin-like protein [Coemansia spiralis]|nr:thioredoxin-like protein [Coemansia spiralis]
MDETNKRSASTTGLTTELLVKRLKISAETIDASSPQVQPQQKALRIGRPAPHFTAPAVLPCNTISTISLSDYKDKYLVLFFYPGDFTSVCLAELTGFSDSLEKFNDCALLFCSVDSEFVHYNWRQQPRCEGGVGELRVPMLADRTRQISRAYGVLDEESQVLRGFFVIDRRQVVRAAVVNDIKISRSVDEAVRLVEAIRLSDENGAGVPSQLAKELSWQ